MKEGKKADENGVYAWMFFCNAHALLLSRPICWARSATAERRRRVFATPVVCKDSRTLFAFSAASFTAENLNGCKGIEDKMWGLRSR
jgi:hypothetical protein